MKSYTTAEEVEEEVKAIGERYKRIVEKVQSIVDKKIAVLVNSLSEDQKKRLYVRAKAQVNRPMSKRVH